MGLSRSSLNENEEEKPADNFLFVSASSRLFKVSLPIIEGGCNRRTKKSYLSAAAAAAAAARKAQFRQKAKSVVRITFGIVFLSPYPELAGTNYILSAVSATAAAAAVTASSSS
jgi:hypothetical protein